MKRSHLTLTTCACAALATATYAEPMTMTLTGVVTTVDVALWSGPFAPGNVMRAVIHYDDAALDQNSDPTRGVYAIDAFGFSVGGYSAFDNGRDIAVYNDIGRDEIWLVAFSPFPQPQPQINDYVLHSFQVLERGPESTFASDALPANLDLGDFYENYFNLIFDYIIPSWPGATVSGYVTSITIEPRGGEPCNPPPSGLVGWWDGDALAFAPHKALDLASGNYAQPVSYARLGIPGAVDLAFSFGGDAAYLYVPRYVCNEDGDCELDLADAITVDAWIKTPGTVDGLWDVIASNFNSNHPTNGWRIAVDENNRFLCDIVSDLGLPIGRTARSLTSVGDDTFHHVACTYDGSAIRVYVDGNLEKTSPYADGIGFVGWLMIGHDGGGSTNARYFDGLIDEVEVFDRALSDDEIRSIYEAGSNGKCKVECASDLNCAPDNICTATGSHTGVCTQSPGEPDSDGDGVVDAEDSCPALAQPVDFSGPEPVLLDPDSDLDGYGDMCDACRLDSGKWVEPCLAAESNTLEAVGPTAEGPILLRLDIDFGEAVTVYRPRCGATVRFEGCDTGQTPCTPLGVTHRYTPQVTPDDLFTGSHYTLYCDLRHFLVGLDPGPGEAPKTIEVVAYYTSEGHTSFEGTEIEQLFIASAPVEVTRTGAAAPRAVSCAVAPDPWYTVFAGTAGPPVEITLGIAPEELGEPPAPITLNGALCDGGGLESPAVPGDGSTTFRCERTGAFAAVGTLVAGATARFVVEGSDGNGDPFEAPQCAVGVADPVEITVDLPEAIQLDANGVTPVCLVSQGGFDATQVDPRSVQVASATVKLKGNGDALASVEDCNGDEVPDLKVKALTAALAVAAGESVEVRGQTRDRFPIPFVGRDSVNLVPGE